MVTNILMELSMAMLRNLFGHQKHHVQKVCIAHDGTGAPVEFSNVGDIDEKNHRAKAGNNNLLVSCDKKGKGPKCKSSKRKDKYQAKANSMEIVHSNSDTSGNGGFHCPNLLFESGSVVEDLDEFDSGAKDLNFVDDLKRSSLKENDRRTQQQVNGEMYNCYYYPHMKDLNMNTNSRLVGTMHPSCLQTSMRSGKIKATCYCSNDVDEQFKPTPVHIFCADSDFGASGAGGVDSDDGDDEYNGDSDFDDGRSKKGKKKTANKGLSKSVKPTKTPAKSKTKTSTSASGE